jgi:hypothetical protein
MRGNVGDPRDIVPIAAARHPRQEHEGHRQHRHAMSHRGDQQRSLQQPPRLRVLPRAHALVQASQLP